MTRTLQIHPGAAAELEAAAAFLDERTRGNDPWLVNSNHDIAMIEVNSGWSQVTDTRVLVQPSLPQGTPNTSATTFDHWYDIKYLGDTSLLPQGRCICYSGGTTRTECLTTVGDSGNWRYLRVADEIGPCQGDGGGPVYKSNTAYGLLQGIDPATIVTRNFGRFIPYTSGPVQCALQGGIVIVYNMTTALQQTNTTYMP